MAANAGNAIFLAAYLIMAFFLTLERVFSSFVRLLGIGQPVEAERQDWQTSLAGGAYLFVLLVEIVAIVWTQSRGPWLGWFFGIYLFVLLTAQRRAAALLQGIDGGLGGAGRRRRAVLCDCGQHGAGSGLSCAKCPMSAASPAFSTWKKAPTRCAR